MKFNLTIVNISMLLISLSLFTVSNSTRLIVVSFDAFRGDYLSYSVTPNLYSVMRKGVSGFMYPVFPSKTYPNHFSIATGLYPESHGIVDNQMYDPELDEIFKKSNLNPKWWDNGYSLPLWIANELSGRKSGVVMWPGCCSIYQGRKASYMKKYNGTMSLEDRADIVFDWMTREDNPANLVFLYINQIDSASHTYGPFSKQAVRQIMNADKLVGYMMEGLKKRNMTKDTNLIFLSDHGMSDINRQKTVNLTQILDTKLFRQFGESQVIGILPNEGKFDKVYKMLMDKALDNHFKVYNKSQIPDKYFYRNNQRIMPIVIEADPGYEVSFSERIHEEPFWGNHGNDNKQSDMRSLFIGYGPNFKRGFRMSKQDSFFNIDLYPLMAKILNLNLNGYSFNGTDKLTGQFLRQF